ncbi:MAG: hypothetical protein ACQESE_02470 [Nanobdellota archaeon]
MTTNEDKINKLVRVANRIHKEGNDNRARQLTKIVANAYNGNKEQLQEFFDHSQGVVRGLAKGAYDVLESNFLTLNAYTTSDVNENTFMSSAENTLPTYNTKETKQNEDLPYATTPGSTTYEQNANQSKKGFEVKPIDASYLTKKDSELPIFENTGLKQQDKPQYTVSDTSKTNTVDSESIYQKSQFEEPAATYTGKKETKISPYKITEANGYSTMETQPTYHGGELQGADVGYLTQQDAKLPPYETPTKTGEAYFADIGNTLSNQFEPKLSELTDYKLN